MRIILLTACGLIASVPAWGAPDWSKAETVTVVMVDNRFQPDHVVFRAGKPTVLHLINKGKEMHEFTAPDFLHAASVADPRALANNGGDIVVQPQQTVAVRLVPGKAGHYELTCADHDWDGMVGSINVVP